MGLRVLDALGMINQAIERLKNKMHLGLGSRFGDLAKIVGEKDVQRTWRQLRQENTSTAQFRAQN